MTLNVQWFDVQLQFRRTIFFIAHLVKICLIIGFLFFGKFYTFFMHRQPFSRSESHETWFIIRRYALQIRFNVIDPRWSNYNAMFKLHRQFTMFKSRCKLNPNKTLTLCLSAVSLENTFVVYLSPIWLKLV